MQPYRMVACVLIPFSRPSEHSTWVFLNLTAWVTHPDGAPGRIRQANTAAWPCQQGVSRSTCIVMQYNCIVIQQNCMTMQLSESSDIHFAQSHGMELRECTQIPVFHQKCSFFWDIHLMDVPIFIFENFDIHSVQFRAQFAVISRNCTEWMSRFILEETDAVCKSTTILKTSTKCLNL